MFEQDWGLLRRLAAECKDAREKVWYLALRAVSSGHRVGLVAEIFCVDPSNVYRWIERWQEERNLADKPREGRPPSLTEGYEESERTCSGK